jgi:hypothetical protein
MIAMTWKVVDKMQENLWSLGLGEWSWGSFDPQLTICGNGVCGVRKGGSIGR